MSKTRNKVIKNFIWRFIERVGAQGVSLVVSWILARILGREVYGTLALVLVFTNIMQVLVDSGLGNALIQKKDADHLDFSSVFFFNLGTCVILYIIMFISAPYIAAFYKTSELTQLIRVGSLIIVISGIKNVQQAYVSRNLIFKKFFFATLGGTLGAAVIGIWMALHGFGVWSYVAQMLFNASIDTFILWITVKWRPKWEFSFERIKGLFAYGWKLLVSALLNTGFENIRSLVIGRVDSKEGLASFNKGQQLPQFVINNINTSISSVLLPVMSEEQDDVSRIKSMTRRAIKTSTYFIAPAMLGLAACGKAFILLTIGEEWLPTLPFLVIFCIAYIFYPIATANLNAMMAMGRSDLFLKLEIIKKSANIIILLLTYKHGIMAIAYGFLVTEFIGQVVNIWPNKRLIGYSYVEQLMDILPAVALATVMGICVYSMNFLGLNMILTFVLQIFVGVAIYVLGSMMFKFDTFSYALGIIRDWKKK